MSPKTLSGLNFVLVGGFSAYHFEVKELIEAHGGQTRDFIDFTTSYVVKGNGIKPENAKIQYALEKGVKIITESDLEAMIRDAYDLEERHVQVVVEREANESYGVW